MSDFRGDSPLAERRLTARAGLWAILTASALAVVGLVLVYDGNLLPNDTAQYLSVARHLVEGQGLKTDLVFFAEHLAVGSMPVEQTVFPPGYPALIAIPGAMGVPVPDAAILVTLASFALIPVVLYLLGLAVGQSPGLALAVSLLWIGLVDNWFITLERQSEMPFILFTLLALTLVPGGPDDRRARPWLAGIMASAALAIRYAGIFFVLAAVIVLGYRYLRRRRRDDLVQLVGFLAAPIITLSWLFWRNHQLVGDFRGGNAFQELKPLGLVILKFYKSACHILGFTGSGLRGLRIGEVLLCLTILLALVLLWQHRQHLGVARKRRDLASVDIRVWIGATYCVVTVALLFYLELTTSLDFQPRMVLVLAPFALLFGGQVVSRVTLTSGRARRAFSLLAILAWVSFLAGQHSVLRQMRSRPNHFMLVDDALSETIAGQPVKQLLRGAMSTDHPLLGNEPQMLGAVLVGPVVGLEPPYYTDRSWTAAEVHELVEHYGIEYVVFMPELFEISAEKPAFFARLRDGEQPEWLEEIVSVPRLSLYRIATVPSLE